LSDLLGFHDWSKKEIQHARDVTGVIMTLAVLRYKLAPYGEAMVGKGAYVPIAPIPHIQQ
jgi:hypothetical protein